MGRRAEQLPAMAVVAAFSSLLLPELMDGEGDGEIFGKGTLMISPQLRNLIPCRCVCEGKVSSAVGVGLAAAAVLELLLSPDGPHFMLLDACVARCRCCGWSRWHTRALVALLAMDYAG